MTFVSAGLGMAALAAAPTLLAVYLFRHRHRRVEVSALMLWQSVARVREGGRALRRTQLPWLFFVELLFLLLCGLAAAGPRWLRPESRRPLVVVADDSASMGARTARQDRLATARRLVARTAAERRWRDVRYVLAGSLARRFDSTDALRSAWTAREPAADLPAALRMARRMAGEEGQVWVVTDHAPAEGDLADGLVRWTAVGDPEPNTAILQAVRSPGEDGSDYCLVGAAHFGPAARHTVLRANWDDAPEQRVELDLRSGEPRYHTFVAPRGAGVGHFRLEGVADALALDDSAVLVPAPRKHVPVAVAVADAALAEPIQAALAATGMAVAAAPTNAAIVITAGDASAGASSADAWSLRFVPAAEARSLLGPFLRRPGHPLLDGMDLQGTAWGASSASVLRGEPILLAGNTPLLAVSTERGRQRIELQLDVGRSNLQRTPDWPVFFANLLAWRWAALPPGLAEPNLRSGSAVRLRAAADAMAVLCETPAGETERLVVRGGVALWTPRETGLHSLRWGTAEGNERAVGVNFLAPDESDLRRSMRGEWGAWREPDPTSRGLQDVAWIVLLAALLVLLAHHALLR